MLRRHPWVFSGAIQFTEEGIKPGETVEVISSDGQFSGWGAYSPVSQIRVRIWSFNRDDIIDERFFRYCIEGAIATRVSQEIPHQTNAYRLISSEGDGLPGLIVDRYSSFLVCQFLSAGVQFWKTQIINELKSIEGIKGIYERSDSEVRKKEGFDLCKGLLWGEIPPQEVEIEEEGLKFNVDIINGHKTGFYLDQRVNRQIVRSSSEGKEVLNCFAYTGGFGLAALKGGAKEVTNIEDVAGLLTVIDKNVHLNQLKAQCCNNVKGDVFKVLRNLTGDGRLYDIIILDPPKFAESQSQLKRAARGYKDINMLAFKMLRRGGLLFTFSCSGLIKMDLFQKIVADAAIDAGREAQIVQWLGQSTDHPVKLHIPETLYLKGLMIEVK